MLGLRHKGTSTVEAVPLLAVRSTTLSFIFYNQHTKYLPHKVHPLAPYAVTQSCY